MVRRTVGTRQGRLHLRRSLAAGARLVPSPVFVICSVRSGSTLLRVLLNSHPKVHAPHELHLRFVRVKPERAQSGPALADLGLDADELEHMLWDRVLHRSLVASGKQVIVDKTPGNCTFFERLRTCWPQARFIILLRHPGSVFASLMDSRPDREREATIKEALLYLNGVEDARQKLPGPVVKYEDLAADPGAVTKRICESLGIGWDPRMLNYGKANHGVFRAGIGDWSNKIRSGKIQKPRPLPSLEETPEELRDLVRAWGYADS